MTLNARLLCLVVSVCTQGLGSVIIPHCLKSSPGPSGRQVGRQTEKDVCIFYQSNTYMLLKRANVQCHEFLKQGATSNPLLYTFHSVFLRAFFRSVLSISFGVYLFISKQCAYITLIKLNIVKRVMYWTISTSGQIIYKR